MTQKDYIAVAAKIRARQPTQEAEEAFEAIGVEDAQGFDQGAENMRRLLAVDLADIFAADNPRFKRSLFMTACGF